jgi:hypothetical protein
MGLLGVWIGNSSIRESGIGGGQRRPPSFGLQLHGQPPDLAVQRADLGAQPAHVAAGRQVEQVPGAGGHTLRRAAGEVLGPA